MKHPTSFNLLFWQNTKEEAASQSNVLQVETSGQRSGPSL